MSQESGLLLNEAFVVRVGYFTFCKNGTRLHLNLTEAGEQGSAGQWSEWHCFGRWGRSWEVQGTSDGKGREDAERRKDCCPGRNLGEKNQDIYEVSIMMVDEISSLGIFSKIHYPH